MNDDMTDEEIAKQEEILQMFGQTLQKTIDENVAQRKNIEERWLSDLYQYHGQYERDTRDDLKNGGNSTVFVNVTRPKTNSANSRVSDMLFPSDDKNWSIAPTPSPEIEKAAETENESMMTIDGQRILGPDGEPLPQKQVANDYLADGKEQAKKMSIEIDDQLTECDFSKIGRQVIFDATKLGTGIVKGPNTTRTSSRSWEKIVENNASTHVIKRTSNFMPASTRVNPWFFFPDMSASSIQDAEFVTELHLLTKKQMCDLAKDETFLSNQIKEIIKGEPRATSVDYLQNIRKITQNDNSIAFNRYEVWEYTGPISKNELQSAGVDVDLDDVLQEIDGVIWICEGRVIKVIVNPMETEEWPYDVFNWEEDEDSIFGFGLPYLLRNAQRVVNAIWRMMMDNAGLSTGPQIIVNDALIEPVEINGQISWELTARKVWRMKDKDRDVNEAFTAFNIDAHLQELSYLLEIAKQLADDETNLPNIAQGNNAGPQEIQTATGMSLLMNNANVNLKGPVKRFDDNVIRPHIRRYYDWNMQNNEKEEIKGDYTVDARGSSALLVKETQAQNMQNLFQISMTEVFAQRTDFDELYRELIKSMQIDPDVIIKSKEQMAEEQKAAQERSQDEQDPALALKRRELDLKEKAIMAGHEKVLADKEIALMKLAIDKGLKIDELHTRLGIQQQSDKTKRDLAATEMKFKIATNGPGI